MLQSPTLNPVAAPIEVRVYQYGLLKVCEWCTAEADAMAIADMWHRERGIHCEIVGLPA